MTPRLTRAHAYTSPHIVWSVHLLPISRLTLYNQEIHLLSVNIYLVKPHEISDICPYFRHSTWFTCLINKCIPAGFPGAHYMKLTVGGDFTVAARMAFDSELFISNLSVYFLASVSTSPPSLAQIPRSLLSP